MTDRTDQELGDLLTATFRAAESLAEPVSESAPRRHEARRRWVPLTAAAAVLAAVGVGWLVDSGRHAEPAADPTPTASTSPRQVRTDAQNHAVAEREAKRVFGLLRMPPGTKRLSGPPPGDLPVGFNAVSEDRSLSRTAWFQVGTSTDLQSYLTAHVPTGMTVDGYGHGTNGSELAYAVSYRRPSEAFIGTELQLRWVAVGGATVVRVDVGIQARPARPARSYLDEPVTSVDVVTISSGTGAGSTPLLPPVRLTSDEDGAKIQRLVSAMNRLLGEPVDHALHGCAPFFNVMTYRLTFHAASGELVYDWVYNSCARAIEVTRNGRRIGPLLDPAEVASLVFDVAYAKPGATPSSYP